MRVDEIRPVAPSSNPKLMQQIGQLACGFPSPGLDHEEPPLSLDELVGMRAPSMFVGRATGHSMRGRGIFDKDYLIINRVRIPRSSGHPFHKHLTTDSTVIRPPIPRVSDH